MHLASGWPQYVPRPTCIDFLKDFLEVSARNTLSVRPESMNLGIMLTRASWGHSLGSTHWDCSRGSSGFPVVQELLKAPHIIAGSGKRRGSGHFCLREGSAESERGANRVDAISLSNSGVVPEEKKKKKKTPSDNTGITMRSNRSRRNNFSRRA